MNVESATFTLRHPQHGPITVAFEGDIVSVTIAGEETRLDNKPEKWGGRPHKPRVQDCKRLIAEVLRKLEPKQEPSVKGDKNRAAAKKHLRKVGLRVIGGGA